MAEAGQKRRRGNVAMGTANMSMAEIGRLLGVSLQTVQQIEKRALLKIQHEIERQAEQANMTVEEWLTS